MRGRTSFLRFFDHETLNLGMCCGIEGRPGVRRHDPACGRHHEGWKWAMDSISDAGKSCGLTVRVKRVGKNGNGRPWPRPCKRRRRPESIAARSQTKPKQKVKEPCPGVVARAGVHEKVRKKPCSPPLAPSPAGSPTLRATRPTHYNATGSERPNPHRGRGNPAMTTGPDPSADPIPSRDCQGGDSSAEDHAQG